MQRKIFGIGLSRTGTTSLNNILEIMGYRCQRFVGSLFIDSNSDDIKDSDALMDSPIPMLY